jgi:hypothetical protein
MGWFGQANVITPSAPIFLLVDKRSEIPVGFYKNGTPWAYPDPTFPHWGYQDSRSMWVAINPLTGFVCSAETAGSAATLYDSRVYARNALSMGGR